MVKNMPANAGDPDLIPGFRRSPREANCHPLQYFCLGNPMGRGAWQATVHGVTRVRHNLVTKSPPITFRICKDINTLVNTDNCLWLGGRCYDQPRQHIKKQRHYFANKGLSSQGYGFSSSHVWMWELNYKESWAPKNWCFWTVVLEKTWESLGLQGYPTSPS